MARSPFQGTFQPSIRPTVVTAPDALVYINGEVDMLGCQNCRRRFDLNKYITSIQVDLSVDSPGGGSASVSMSVPRHSIDDFYFDGKPLITEMMEIEIYAKGYYLVEGLPQYYPIFWGLITEVTDSFSSGEHSFSISCSDILKWWEICRMNVNAAFTVPSGQQDRNIYGNVFYGTNPYDVIWTLAQASFGDVIVATGSLNALKQEERQQTTFQHALTDVMLYWEQRFRRIRSNLVLYGVNGVAVRGSSFFDKHPEVSQTNEHLMSTAVAQANGRQEGQMIFDPTSPEVTAFRTQFGNAPGVNFWQSEYQTKLELANAAKDAIGFEFYMDPSGDIVFKPPFFNLDVLGNKPVSWIQDIDIIDYSWPQSEAEVVTQLTLQGSFEGNIEYNLGEETTPLTSVTDYHLLRKYGWRPETYNSEFLGKDLQAMFLHGMDVLDRRNSKRFKGSVTIPMRPELRLGFPVYIPYKDEIWYVSGISHSIQFGGRATTTLSLTARRSKWFAPTGIGELKFKNFSKGATANPGGSAIKYSSKTISQSANFELRLTNAGSVPPTEVQPGQQDPNAPLILTHPKTGRPMGYPNAVMVYTRPFKADTGEIARKAGIKPNPAKNPYANPKTKAAIEANVGNFASHLSRLSASEVDELQAKYYNNRYQYGLNSAGVYSYAYDSKKIIGEIVLLPAANIDVRREGGASNTSFFQGSTAMIRPVSDERGFEVIGHYRYGRGVSLRDGKLILTEGGANQAAAVDLQLALSGDLKGILAAQSQGITTINTGHPDPASSLSRLSPDGTDLQTAAIINPDTKAVEFANGGINDSGTAFVESRTLGSTEDRGFAASAEASQLSRALTLAELRVIDAGAHPDPNCTCLLGRRDLHFISVGYQVKSIRQAIGATGLFESTAPGAQLISGDAATSEVLTSAANANRPVPPTQIPPTDKVLQRIDTFLHGLYKALDAPHRAYEKELRQGKTVDDPTADRFAPGTPQLGDLSPPFSAPNRFVLGDSNATIGQVSTATRGLKEAWNNFGQNLQNGVERERLSELIANRTAEIARLTKEKQALEIEIRDGGATVVGRDPAPVRLEKVNAQIVKAQQEIANYQAELNLIPPVQRT